MRILPAVTELSYGYSGQGLFQSRDEFPYFYLLLEGMGIKIILEDTWVSILFPLFEIKYWLDDKDIDINYYGWSKPILSKEA